MTENFRTSAAQIKTQPTATLAPVPIGGGLALRQLKAYLTKRRGGHDQGHGGAVGVGQAGDPELAIYEQAFNAVPEDDFSSSCRKELPWSRPCKINSAEDAVNNGGSAVADGAGDHGGRAVLMIMASERPAAGRWSARLASVVKLRERARSWR